MQCLMLLLNIHNAEKQYPNLIQTLLVFQETTNTLINAVRLTRTRLALRQPFRRTRTCVCSRHTSASASMGPSSKS